MGILRNPFKTYDNIDWAVTFVMCHHSGVLLNGSQGNFNFINATCLLSCPCSVLSLGLSVYTTNGKIETKLSDI